MPWMLLLPPAALWGLLYWQDWKTSATRNHVVKSVIEHLEHGWLLERGDIRTLVSSAARGHRLILPMPSVDEVLEEVVGKLFADFDGYRYQAVDHESARGLLQSRVGAVRNRMTSIPPVRPTASTAFAIGAGIVLVLMGLLVYLPVSMNQRSPLEDMGSAGKMLSSLNSFWDELIGVIATNVVGLAGAWFVASPRMAADAIGSAVENG